MLRNTIANPTIRAANVPLNTIEPIAPVPGCLKSHTTLYTHFTAIAKTMTDNIKNITMLPSVSSSYPCQRE